MEEKKNREGKGGKYLKISPKIVKDIEKSRCSRLLPIFGGVWNRFQRKKSRFWFRKVSLGKKSRFWFWKIWSRKKVSVSVLENMVWKKVSVSVSVMVMMTMACVWCHQWSVLRPPRVRTATSFVLIISPPAAQMSLITSGLLPIHQTGSSLQSYWQSQLKSAPIIRALPK